MTVTHACTAVGTSGSLVLPATVTAHSCLPLANSRLHATAKSPVRMITLHYGYLEWPVNTQSCQLCSLGAKSCIHPVSMAWTVRCPAIQRSLPLSGNGPRTSFHSHFVCQALHRCIYPLTCLSRLCAAALHRYVVFTISGRLYYSIYSMKHVQPE